MERCYFDILENSVYNSKLEGIELILLVTYSLAIGHGSV